MQGGLAFQGRCASVCQQPQRPEILPPVPQYRVFQRVGENKASQHAFVDSPVGTSHAPLKAPVLDKSSILKSLLQFSDADLAKLVDQLFFERPSLRHLSATTNGYQGSPIVVGADGQAEDTQVQELTNGFEMKHEETIMSGKVSDRIGFMDSLPVSAKMKRMSIFQDIHPDDNSTPPPRPQLPTVQFTASMYFALESEGFATVELMRIGLPSSIEGTTAVVKWETADGSAKAGEKYHATRGECRFASGETFAKIRIELIQQTKWDPTLDFYVLLKEEGVDNLDLHRYHMKCRIKIIDNDAFPTARFETDLLSDKVENVPPEKLMIEYFKMNFKDRIVRRGTIKCIFADAAKNMLFISLLALRVVMINELFMPVLSGEKKWTNAKASLLLMAAGFFHIPEHILHLVDFRRQYWQVAGASRRYLQANLMRKFMCYTSDVRDKIDHGMVILSLYRGIPELVEQGYLGIFPIVKNLMLLALLLLYQTVGTSLMGLKTSEPQWIAGNCAILLVFPMVMLIALKLRTKKAHRLQSTAKLSLQACTSYTIDVLNNYFLLADYGNRGQAIRTFESKIDEFNVAKANDQACEVNNKFIPKSLNVTICAMWIVFGGALLVTGRIEMGTYLANWQIFQQIGESWGEIYRNVLEAEECIHDLKILVRLMNYPTETVHEKAFIETSCLKSRDMASSIFLDSSDDISFDNIPIRIVNVAHCFSNGFKAVSGVTMDLDQGKLHMIVGRRGCGKTTLLKLIGCRHVKHEAQEGSIVLPTHLRLLHISKEPLFFSGTLFDNLTYGVLKGDKDGRLERVLRICKGLDIKEDVLNMITDEPDAAIAQWSQILSRSDCHLLNIARGIVTSPDILCVHKPSMGLGPNTVPIVFRLLRTYVSHRGVGHDPQRYFFRRPRTCIFTFTTEVDKQYADVVHQMKDSPSSS